jgi:hypothetical protein
MNEYKVSGFVRVYYATVVSADSPEEARELVEKQTDPAELCSEAEPAVMEIEVQDVGVY